MLQFLRNLFGRQPQAPPVRSQGEARRMLRARYDAATTTETNRRYWTAGADALSSKAANRPEIRRILRNRARYEVANNPRLKGMIDTLTNDVIGTGPRLCLGGGDHTVNRQIEQAFASWSKAIGLAEKLRTLHNAKVIDGEAFAVLTTNKRIAHDVKLDIKTVECDQFSSPFFLAETIQFLDGIVFDAAGNPTQYHMLKVHPGDYLMVIFTLEYDVIDASQVIHWFRRDRPGQVRGVPEILSCLETFAELRRFSEATIQAAWAAASQALVIESQGAADIDPATQGGTPFDVVELESGMATTLPYGYKLSQVHSENPATTYEMFEKAKVREGARCLNMPLNIALGDSSGYNYASGRLDHQTYYRGGEIRRDQGELVALRPILGAFVDEASLLRIIPPAMPPFETWQYQWFWDGPEHVDPSKEASAQAQRLENGTTTLAREYARQGQDWMEAITQRGEEIRFCAEQGVPLAVPAAGGGGAGDEASPGDTNEAEVNAALQRRRLRAAEQPRVPAGSPEGGEYGEGEGEDHTPPEVHEARDKEDEAIGDRWEKEDRKIDRGRDREDEATSRAQDKEDRLRDKARVKEDDRQERANNREHDQLDRRQQRETNDEELRHGDEYDQVMARTDGDEEHPEWKATEARHEKETAEREARHEKEFQDLEHSQKQRGEEYERTTQAAREREDREIEQRREQEHEPRQARRDAEDQRVQDAREAEDRTREQERDAQDAEYRRQAGAQAAARRQAVRT